MADSVVLVTQKREGRGSRAAAKLRAGGRVPGVVYGHKEQTVSVSVDEEALVHAVRHGARVVDLQGDGPAEKALIRELQWDHLGKEVLHVDFMRVSQDERIEVRVPVELRGTAPGAAAGGVLEQPLHSLHVECLAISIPASIRVNVGELQLDGAVHVRELTLPPGVKALDDPDAIVVHVKAPRAEAEAPAAEAGPAEPERIGGAKPAEEGAEE